MGRPKTYEVHLSPEERNHLIELLAGGTNKVCVIKRAQVLLKADDGWTDQQIAAALPVGQATVGRIRRRYAEGGLARALYDEPRGCWPSIWCAWRRCLWKASPMRRYGKCSKKRTPALASAGMGDPAGGQCRVRVCHGTYSGPVSTAVSGARAGGLCG